MPHYVHPVIDGDWISVRFTCDEPEGSMCRITCPPEESCEFFNVVFVDGEPWHEGYRYDDETDEETEGPLHKMIGTKSCTIMEFDALQECFGGKGEQPLREGEVRFWWEDDGYMWDYVSPVSDRASTV